MNNFLNKLKISRIKYKNTYPNYSKYSKFYFEYFNIYFTVKVV